MEAVYAFGLLILIASLGARFIARGRFLSPFQTFISSGFIYILLGLALGGRGLNILSASVLEGLAPLVGLGLGWVGFLFGFQLEARYLKRFPRVYIGLSLLQSLAVFAAGALVCTFLLKELYPGQKESLLLGMAVALGLLMSMVSPTLLHGASGILSGKGDHYYLGRFLTSIGSFWGIAGLAVLSSFWHYPFFTSRVFLKGGGLFLAATLFPVIMGWIFHLLTRKRATEEQMLVLLLGIVFFASGAALYFHLFPLYVSMVMGMVFSNLTRIHERLYPLLLSTEKPLYITFLILIGALWELNLDARVALLALVIIAFRILAFTVPLPAIRAALGFPLPLPPRFGLCFLSQGGIGIAFAVGIKLSYPVPLTEIFLSAALLGIVASELLAPWGIKMSAGRMDQGGAP